MGISMAQDTLQGLVDQHNGVSYKEALEEIRAYIAEVKKPSNNTASPKLPDETVEDFNRILAKYRNNMWSNEQYILDKVASFIGRELRAGA